MPAPDKSPPPDPRFRFYGRRRGKKAGPRRRALLQNLLPQIAPDPARLPPGPLWLEIGAGGGEHLLARAAANPDTHIIGCEPFMEGVSKTLSALESMGLGNVLLHADDARPLLAQLPEGRIGRCFILFPDPWPKRRHHRRRFVNAENLDRLSRIMAPGARLGIATDHIGYARRILRLLLDHPGFEWTAERADDWRRPPCDHIRTRYEAKALARGDHPLYFDFVRRA